MANNTLRLEMSVTNADLRTFLRIWHQTRIYGELPQITDRPMINLDGVNYHLTTPLINPDRAAAILAQFNTERIDTQAATR